MKSFIAVIIIAIVGFRTMAATIKIPTVSVAFSNIVANLDKDHTVYTESTWSNPNSSIEKKPDYFVVGSIVKEDGGRILQMNPFRTDSNGVEQPPNFTDIITGETRILPYQTVDNRKTGGSDYYHHGVITIGEDKYYVVVAYDGDMQHPVVMITWGKGSDILAAGEMIDSFEVLSTQGKVSQSKVGIGRVNNQQGVPDGVYLFVDSTKEYGQFTLLESNDLNVWTKSELKPYMIYGYTVIYKTTGVKSFFRIE